MAASKALRKSGSVGKAVAKKVATAAGAARKAVQSVVSEATTRRGKKATKPATKRVVKKVATAKHSAAKKASARTSADVAERRTTQRLKKAAKKAKRVARKAERVAKKAAKTTKKLSKKASRRTTEERTVGQRITAQPTARKKPRPKKGSSPKGSQPNWVTKQVGKVAKQVVEAASDATQSARKAVKDVVARGGPKTARPAVLPGGASPPAVPVAGDPAPEFRLMDQDDTVVTSASLAGQPYVVYFYPKDNTSGCTKEAQGFRDEAAAFAELGIRVIGVSPDSAKSHRGFREKHGLKFSLLADPDRVLAKAYGAYGPKRFMGREGMGIIRSTFLVDAKGRIRRTWRGVRVDGHVAEVLDAARGLGLDRKA